MGSHIQWLSDPQATSETAPELATALYMWLIERRIIQPEPKPSFNGSRWVYSEDIGYSTAVIKPHPLLAMCGVVFEVGPTLIYNPSRDFFACCPACGHRCDSALTNRLVSDWCDMRSPQPWTCAACTSVWHGETFDLSQGYVRTYLAVQCTNWAEMSKPFIAEMSAVIGHELEWYYAKI
jgi:hypothetical protein